MSSDAAAQQQGPHPSGSRTPDSGGGAWAPLRSRVYRRLWLAQAGGNLGTWMQTVGAQWLIVTAGGSALLVGLVLTASTLPIVLLAAPAGVLADLFDRRKLIIVVQLVMALAGTALATLTFIGLANPAVVLAFTFIFGCGAALIWPAWQAIQPDLVPRSQLAQASSLAAVNMNLARSVGPALGGVLVAAAGAGWVFGLNAASFLLIAAAVRTWKSDAPSEHAAPERMMAGLRSGARYVRHSNAMRRILAQVLLFVPVASAPWALTPLVASSQLQVAAGGYGLLLGAMGVGAVAASTFLPVVRRHWGVNTLITASFVVYAAALLGLAYATNLVAAGAALALIGAAWLSLLSTINATIQTILPNWVRARGLSYYLAAVSVGQAVGGIVWGVVAAYTDVRFSMLAAAGALTALAVVGRVLPLPDLSRVQPDPTTQELPPGVDQVLEPDAGPILVIVEYAVRPADVSAFAVAMDGVARVRRRTGARRWALFRDPLDTGRYLETFIVDTWSEHRRQHLGRVTVRDQEILSMARACLTASPTVRHLVSAATPLRNDPTGIADPSPAVGDGAQSR